MSGNYQDLNRKGSLDFMIQLVTKIDVKFSKLSHTIWRNEQRTIN